MMIRLLSAISISMVALFTTSCFCCSSGEDAPSLRKLPEFQEIQTAPIEAEAAPKVEATK